MGQSQFLNGGFGDDHHPGFAGFVGILASHGAKAKTLIIFSDIESFRTEFHWPYRHSTVFSTKLKLQRLV